MLTRYIPCIPSYYVIAGTVGEPVPLDMGAQMGF